MSEVVMADPQFGIAHILRPFPGFEAVYDGQPSGRPIMFTEGGVPGDPLAGQPGYDPGLVRGLSVPMGSRALIWLPRIVPAIGGTKYVWRFIWRMRNVFDFRQRRSSFHYPKQVPGVPSAGGQPRVIIPAAYETVVYNQPEACSFDANAVQNLQREDMAICPSTITDEAPRGPFNTIAQGVAPTGVSQVLFFLHETMCKGDELLIGVSKLPEGAWDFATDDSFFSFVFGNGTIGLDQGPYPDIGVYVLTGVSS